MEEFQPLLDAALKVVVNIGAVMILVAIGFVIDWLKARGAMTKNALLNAIIAQAVNAADQQFEQDKGAAKFDWVCGYLESRGIDCDRAVIEAQVRRLKREIAEDEAFAASVQSGGAARGVIGAEPVQL